MLTYLRLRQQVRHTSRRDSVSVNNILFSDSRTLFLPAIAAFSFCSSWIICLQITCQQRWKGDSINAYLRPLTSSRLSRSCFGVVAGEESCRPILIGRSRFIFLRDVSASVIFWSNADRSSATTVLSRSSFAESSSRSCSSYFYHISHIIRWDCTCTNLSFIRV